MDRRGSETVIEQSYSLHDSNYAHELLTRLNALRSQSGFTDAILCVGRDEFPCHRNVMAVSSPYFKAMFSCNLKESRECRIFINDINPLTMRCIIDYAYSGHMEITVENAQELLTAASLFEYPAIVEACCELLRKHLHVSNCLGVENFAHLHSCDILQKEAYQYAIDNFSVVVDQEEFLELSKDKLLEMISSEHIDVRCEEVVYEAVIAWVTHDLNNRQKELPDLFDAIRFATMSKEYLKSVVLKEELAITYDSCRSTVEEAIKFLESDSTETNRMGRKRLSMRSLPRPSTVAKEVIVLIGGRPANNYMSQSVEVYEPHKDKWSYLPEMPESVSFFSVTTLNNTIYVTGGIVDGLIVPNVWKFEPEKRVWGDAPPMLQPRAQHACAALGDKIYVVGGITLANNVVHVETIECFDSVTNQWSTVGQCPFPRKQARCVRFSNMLVEIGGLQQDIRVKTIECYRPNDGTLKYSGEQFVLTEAIQFSQIVVLNSVFYIIWEDTKKMISLNPEKRTLRKLPDMQYSHIHSAATVLNEKIYITGGLIDSKPSRIVEVFDPATETWSIVKSTKGARACHGAVTVSMSTANC